MKKELTIGCKASKDRLSVLLGANVTGDFNLEPVLIYHTKILQPLRITSHLPGSSHMLCISGVPP